MITENSCVAKSRIQLPTRKFTVTYILEETGEKTTIHVDPEAIPFGRTGREGSLLDIALGSGLAIDHACGGICACATCHVHVKEGLESCPEATEDELDELDSARELTLESRLSCQCVPNGEMNLVVVVPAWNKNFAREGHGT
jgi:ferredoxin, 2Fe-2S